MKNFKKSVLLILLLSLYIGVQAQPYIASRLVDGRKIGYLSVGVNVGFTNYFGDLNPQEQYISTDLTKTRPSIGINLTRKLSPRIMVRGDFNWARLAANDFQAADPVDERSRYRYIRNAHFRNDLWELSAVVTYDLLRSPFVFHKRVPVTPYLLLGLGLFYHDPKAKTPEEFGNDWVRLRPLRTEGQGLVREFGPNAGTKYDKPYSLFQPVIPVGVGVRFKLNDRTDLSFEVAYRISFTDYLDDVGGNYANPNDLESDLARAVANRTLELTDAQTGGSRSTDLDNFINNVSPIVLDQAGRPTITGFGNDGDKRGENANQDIYLVAGFKLNYILGVGLRCPGGGKR